MIVVANSGLINFKKTGTIRTRGVLSKKGEKKALDFFLVLLPKSQLYYFYRYLISVLSIVHLISVLSIVPPKKRPKFLK